MRKLCEGSVHVSHSPCENRRAISTSPCETGCEGSPLGLAAFRMELPCRCNGIATQCRPGARAQHPRYPQYVICRAHEFAAQRAYSASPRPAMQRGAVDRQPGSAALRRSPVPSFIICRACFTSTATRLVFCSTAGTPMSVHGFRNRRDS